MLGSSDKITTPLTDVAYHPRELSTLCAPFVKTALTHLLASAKLATRQLKTDETQTIVLESLDLGHSIYLKLEKIKSALQKQKIQLKTHYQYSAHFLLGRLSEHPQLNANPAIAARTACSHYFFLYATTTNTSNINKAYQLAVKAITGYESDPENKAKLKEKLYAIRVIQLFVKSISDISFKNTALTKEVQEMMALSQALPPRRHR